MINIISVFLSLMSRQAVYNLSTFLSFMVYRVFKVRRNLVHRNINTAYPGRYDMVELDKIGFESVRNFIFTELELLASRSGNLAESVHIENEGYLREILARGQGGYLLCIHIGSWEAAGAAITRKIAPTNIIVKKVGGPRTNAFIKNLREKNGFLSIKREKKGDVARSIVKALAKGELVGFVMDQARPGEPMLPFFGKPAKTNTSFAAIWRKYPAPIIPVWCQRTEVGKYILGFEKEITPVQTHDSAQDIIENSMLFNKVVENLISRCPEQYFWLHDRWKSE